MHPVGKPPVRRGEEYRRPEGDLDLRTSYAQQYTRTCMSTDMLFFMLSSFDIDPSVYVLSSRLLSTFL